MSLRSAIVCALVLLTWFGGFVASPESAVAQARRAMLVGINDYSPPEGVESLVNRKWRDLEGAQNDVETMRAILETRFGFENFHTLVNRDATRDAILAGIRDFLVEQSAPGDIVVFYYAGHGSQVKNTASREADKLDETIVPADAWRGAQDIRDKELRDAFNALLSRGVSVTLIFDSCHSGSITRGLPAGKSRFIEASPLTVSDPSDPPKPVDRGALILSAAQDNEVARELADEQGSPRGAFTWALARAIESHTPDESAEQLFLRARAILRSSGATQEPIMSGRAERRSQQFLGTEAASTVTAAVPVIEVESDGSVVLQGGIATGLRPGATLVRRDADSTVVARLEVTQADGLARSIAVVIEGDELPEPGQSFTIERWVSSASAPLRLYVPEAGPGFDDLVASSWITRLAASGATTWVDDPTVATAHLFIIWRGGAWVLIDAGGNTTDLGQLPDVSAVEAVAASSGVERPGLFVSIPPFAEFAERFSSRLEALDASVQFVDDPAQATYILSGRPAEGGLADGVEYAWVLREATAGATDSPAPARSDWLLASPSRMFATAILARDVNKLNVIWGWLNLQSPPDDGTFPYRFSGFENVADGTRRYAGDTLRVGEQYRVVLETDYAELEKARVQALVKRSDKRYVYLFIMDRSGNGYLLYPAIEHGNVENDIVLFSDLPTTIRLPSDDGVMFVVAEPVGMDSFFLITTAQPIPQPGIFNFEGVRTRGPATGEHTDLSKLFYALGSGTRSAKQPVPTSWSLDRITVRSAQ